MSQAPQSYATPRHPAASITPLGTLFERLLSNDFFGPVSTPKTSLPLSVWQDEHKFYVEVDAPGVKSEDVHITVHNRELIITGERKSERRDDAVDTRTYGRFEQRLSLPQSVDDGKVEAKLSNGVLHVTIPKSEQAKPRKIEVKVS